MGIRRKSFSLRRIVFGILLIAMLLLGCLAATLFFSARQNRSLVKQYISETAELYASQLGNEISVMRYELMSLLDSAEVSNELPAVFDSKDSSVFQTLKKISEQLRIQAIWHDKVYGYYEYIKTADALITSKGTKFSGSVLSSTEAYLMNYFPQNMEGRQNALLHDFLTIDENRYLLTWYVKDQKAACNLIELDKIFEDLESRTKEYRILPFIYDKSKSTTIFPVSMSSEEIQEFEQGRVIQSNIYRYSIKGLGELGIYVIPDNGVLQSMDRWEWLLIAMIICCIVTCAVLVIIYVHQVLKPLKRFVDSLDEIDTDTYLHEDSTNRLLELESANEQFRNLIRKIQALKITIYEKELNEKQIELEFAQEQIRPHFFLNCISLIHSIADQKGENDIVNITTVLSDYIRYIYKGSTVLRPLCEELEHVKNYITIQQFRYGEQYFRFDCMVDEGLEEAMIPVLLLQTLVENSFSHGMRPGHKGEISLFITRESYEENQYLYMCVSDNGPGFDPEILHRLKEEQQIYYNNRYHVGLQNIKKRLNLIYADRAMLSFTNMDEGFGAISEVRIRWDEEMEQNT